MIAKLIIVPLILVVALGFYSYKETGKVIFLDDGALDFISSRSGDSTAELRAKITKKENINTSKDMQTFYKWKDANGRWQYGTQAPEGVDGKSVNYDPTSNLVSAVKIRPREPQRSSKFSMPGASKAESKGLPNAVQTLKDAQNIQQKLNDRYSNMNEQLK